MSGLTPAEMKTIHAFIRDMKEILERKEGTLGEDQISEILTKYREEIFEMIERDYQWIGTYNVDTIVQKVRDKVINELLEEERRQPIFTFQLGVSRNKNGEVDDSWRDIPLYIGLLAYILLYPFNIVAPDLYSLEFVLSGVTIAPILFLFFYRYVRFPILQVLGLFGSYHYSVLIILFYWETYQGVNWEMMIYLIPAFAGIMASALPDSKTMQEYVERLTIAFSLLFVIYWITLPIIGKNIFITISIMAWIPFAAILGNMAAWYRDKQIQTGISPSVILIGVMGFPFAVFYVLFLTKFDQNSFFSLELGIPFGILSLLVTVLFALTIGAKKEIALLLHLMMFQILLIPSSTVEHQIPLWIGETLMVIIAVQGYKITEGKLSKEEFAKDTIKIAFWLVPFLFLVLIATVSWVEIVEPQINHSILLSMIATPPLALLILLPSGILPKKYTKEIYKEMQVQEELGIKSDPNIINISIDKKKAEKYYKLFKFNWILFLTVLVTVGAIAWALYLNIYQADDSYEDVVIGIALGFVATAFFLTYVIEALLTYFTNGDYRILLDYWFLNEGSNVRTVLDQPIGDLSKKRVQKRMAKLIREGTIIIRGREVQNR